VLSAGSLGGPLTTRIGRSALRASSLVRCRYASGGDPFVGTALSHSRRKRPDFGSDAPSGCGSRRRVQPFELLETGFAAGAATGRV
jgi:hypothetical protein